MADWKKVAVSGSDISQFNNNSGYITSATANHAFATASFNGTNLVANSSDGTLNFTSGSGGQLGILITANAGTDTLDFSLGANSVKNAALVNPSLKIGSTDLELGGTGSIFTGLVSVTSQGFTGSLSSTSVLANGVTAFTQTAGDSSTKVATTAFVAAAATAADLDLAGDGSTTTAVDLDSQTLTFKGEDGLQLSASAQTITATIADDSIANAKLANSTISGKELGTDLDDLRVDNATLNFDGGGAYNGSAIKIMSIKDGGVDTAAIADSLGTLGVNQFTGSFSGSFTGDVDINLADLTAGDGLSGTAYNGNVARSFSVQKDVATGGSTVPVAVSSNGVGLDLSTIDGTGIGVTTSELSLDIKAIIASNGNNRILTSNGDAANTLTAEPNFTFNGTDLLVTGNERITGNLVVEGTASFQNQENLQVADRFILMASGSATAGDGGIVVQQGTQDVGELFGFDANLTRWAITSSFDASLSTFVPDAFMATAIEGAGTDPDATPARYDKKGNIFVGTDQGIWIYS